jgi:hypothetical protein
MDIHKVDVPADLKPKKRRPKENNEAEIAEREQKLAKDFRKLWDESKIDPYKKIDPFKGDGKIQVREEDAKGDKIPAKYRYFIRRRKN